MNDQPIAIEVTEGLNYKWCTCGQSKNQPFCDGSHIGTGKVPLSFTARKTDTVYLCTCRQTENAPFCDGAHKYL